MTEFGSDYIMIDEDLGEELQFRIIGHESSDELFEREVQAIKYICLLKEPYRILNSQLGLEALNLILDCAHESVAFESLDDTIRAYYVEFVVDFLNRLSDNLDGIISSFTGATSRKQQRQFRSRNTQYLELRIDYLLLVLRILLATSSRSARFCLAFQRAKGVSALLAYLRHKSLLHHISLYCTSEPSHCSWHSLKHILDCVLGSIKNLSVHADRFRADWHEARALDALRHLIDGLGFVADYGLLTYVTMANILDNQLDKQLEDIDALIKDIVDLLQTFADNLSSSSSNMVVQRLSIVVEATDYDCANSNISGNSSSSNNKIIIKNMLKEVAFIDTASATRWNIVELLKTLHHLIVNNAVKYEALRTYSLVDHLSQIIRYGNEAESANALNVLWQACFDAKVARDVRSDSVLFNFLATQLEDIVEQPERTNATAAATAAAATDDDETAPIISGEATKNGGSITRIKMCQGVMWQLKKAEIIPTGEFPSTASQREKIFQWTSALRATTTPQDELSGHIMISYNRESRPLCLSVKRELESIGFRVWIDVEDIHGSSLEAMANAIEMSECVLVCMTEKYKQSNNCRAEAEYAFQIKKRIVPLIMQPNYKPDGWLGIILGSKIFIDFTKYELDECMRRLRKELVPIYSKSLLNYAATMTTTVADSSASSTTSRSMSPYGAAAAAAASMNESADSTKLSRFLESFQHEVDKLDWSEKQVDEWLASVNINRFIVESVMPCDGKLLYEMYTMYLSAPESFYSALNKTGEPKINLRDIVKFTTELKNLFGN